MHRRIGIVPMIVTLGIVLIAFFWASTKLMDGITETNTQYQEAVTVNNTLETRQNDLKDTLVSASSDAFVEKQARTLYGYMSPNEIRLVITNPEALYGTQGN